MHDTSITMLEAHYAKFITSEVEDRSGPRPVSFESAEIVTLPVRPRAREQNSDGQSLGPSRRLRSNLSHVKMDRLIASLSRRCGKCCLNEYYMSTLVLPAADVQRWRSGKPLRYSQPCFHVEASCGMHW